MSDKLKTKQTIITWHPYPEEKPSPVPIGYLEGMFYNVLTSTGCMMKGSWYGDDFWLLEGGDWTGHVLYWGTVEHNFDFQADEFRQDKQ